MSSKPEVSQFLSGYEIAAELKVRFNVERKPQMVYNYIKNGLIASTRVEIEGKEVTRVTREVAEAWMKKFSAEHAVTK